jgi:uncharacterized repeat protein (TIGR01451 family)
MGANANRPVGQSEERRLIRSLMGAGLSALLALASSFVFTSVSYAQVCAAPGSSGTTIPAGIVNSYWGASGNPSAVAGGASLPLGNQRGGTANIPPNTTAVVTTTGLSAGDLVLVMQMQGTNAGVYEYATVVSPAGPVTSGAVTVRGAGAGGALVNAYTQNFGSGNTYQIIRVPQYSSGTVAGVISAPPWDIDASGQGTGGVVAIDTTGALNLNANVNVTGQGFRGGAGFTVAGGTAGLTATTGSYSSGSQTGASKGEGTSGTPGYVFDGYGDVIKAYGTTGLANASFAGSAPTTGAGAINGNYAAGSFGFAALGTAGGGGNDSNPGGGINQNNSGGGGGGNAGAGGQGGWTWPQSATACTTAPRNLWNPTTCPYVAATGGVSDVGGRGGLAQAGVGAARVVLGGGGGAGTANNNGATRVITTYPPTNPARDATTNAGAANGADGPIALSGARGGGIVLLRAGRLVPGGGQIIADGVRAYNTGGTGSEAAGGGGAGGSIVILANAASASVPTSAAGGLGGDSNFWAHGPGGGGAGGVVVTNVATTAAPVPGAAAGFTPNTGGPPANYTFPNQFGATPGGTGLSSTAGGTPSGAAKGADCAPQLTTTKTSLPNASAASIVPPGAGTYMITVVNANTAGTAQAVNIFDPALPSSPNISVANPPVPTIVIAANAGGGYTTAQCQALAVRSGATDFTNAATANLNAGGWVLPGGCSVAYTFTVNVAAATPDGLYQNDAGASFLDPTRSTTTRRVTPATAGVTTPTGTFTVYETAVGAGPTTTIGGSNYDGDLAANTGEDIRVQRLRAYKSVNRTADPDGTASTTAGDSLVWSVFVNNPGATPITAFQVLDVLPAGVTITAAGAQAITSTSGACGAITVNAAYTGVAPNTGLIAAAQTMGANCTLRIDVPVTINAAFGGTSLSNQATVSGNTPAGATPTVSSDSIDSTTTGLPAGVTLTGLPGTNIAQIQTAGVDATVATLTPKVNLSVTKSDSKTSTVPGASNIYTIVVANAGPGSADGAVIRDPAVAGLSCTTAPTCAVTAGAAVCPSAAQLTVANLQNPSPSPGIVIPTLPANSSLTLTLTCTVTATGS